LRRPGRCTRGPDISGLAVRPQARIATRRESGHSSASMSEPRSAREPVVAPDGVAAELSMVVPESPAAVVVIVPGMGVPASYYEPLARALARRGLAVATSELRGIGTSSIRARRGTDFGWRELVELDMPAILDAARRCLGD